MRNGSSSAKGTSLRFGEGCCFTTTRRMAISSWMSKQRYRQQGFGSYLVQEIKRPCYEMGKIPAARCGARQCHLAANAGKSRHVGLRARAAGRRGPYTLNLKSITSPSATTYSLPSIR